MEVHLISSLLFFLGRCSATTSGDVTQSFMAGLIIPNQSMILTDFAHWISRIKAGTNTQTVGGEILKSFKKDTPLGH